ncbi:MAG: cysteine--tRNA ligase, partial [Nitriliruptorales bacterium]|nr:cysteine--tRNA ligase [Nitriliruptorales bacterium]
MSVPGAPLTLFNTMGRRLERFEPATAGRLSMYTCGPTVYAFAHIGNMRTYVGADLLRRLFEWKGLAVRQVMNITDVGHLTSDDDLTLSAGEDKLELASRREGRSIWDLAEYYTEAFKADLRLLGIRDPSLWVKATDHIPEMIAFASRLHQRGHAYETPSGLYFDVSTARDYGKLAGLDLQGLQEGARVAPTEGKRHPQDFALWRPSPPGANRLMEWDSPWGKGAPGWHLECSVMSIQHLGERFDVHTGGVDHIPVHHTNEIAQSEAYLDDGEPWVRHWFHNEFLVMRGGKASKSRGDTLRVRTLAEDGFAAPVYRYLILTAHYRSQLEFSWDALRAARTSLSRLAERFPALEPSLSGGGASPSPLRTYVEAQAAANSNAARSYIDEFDAAMSQDLNSARALATLSKLSHDLESLGDEDRAVLMATVGALLGLDLATLDRETLRGSGPSTAIAEAGEVEALLEERERARSARDYARADAIREKLHSLGVAVEDTPDGPRV